MTAVTPVSYEWKDGFPTRGIDPNIAGRELDRIARRDQEVVPMTVVEESRAADAPLHNAFEWDDTVAAESYREDQARQIIRSLKVVYVRNDIEEPLPPVRAYISVLDEPQFDMYAPNQPKLPRERHYRPIVKVMSSEELRDQYRRQAFDTLCSWRDRYQDIEDFAGIFEEIDTLRVRYKAA